jgi:hypothetical protein
LAWPRSSGCAQYFSGAKAVDYGAAAVILRSVASPVAANPPPAGPAYTCTDPGTGYAKVNGKRIRGNPEQEFVMKATNQPSSSSSADRIWKALRPSLPESTEPAGADEPNEMRRLMLQSQEFRAIVSAADMKSADKSGKGFDRSTIDTVFACLAICTEEQRRAMSSGSNEGANAMRHAMHAMKKKFGLG